MRCMKGLLIAAALFAGCHTHEVGRGDRAPQAQGKGDEKQADNGPVHMDISSGRPVRPTPSG